MAKYQFVCGGAPFLCVTLGLFDSLELMRGASDGLLNAAHSFLLRKQDRRERDLQEPRTGKHYSITDDSKSKSNKSHTNQPTNSQSGSQSVCVASRQYPTFT